MLLRKTAMPQLRQESWGVGGVGVESVKEGGLKKGGEAIAGPPPHHPTQVNPRMAPQLERTASAKPHMTPLDYT